MSLITNLINFKLPATPDWHKLANDLSCVKLNEEAESDGHKYKFFFPLIKFDLKSNKFKIIQPIVSTSYYNKNLVNKYSNSSCENV